MKTSLMFKINGFNRRTKFNVHLSELWKYYRINNSKNKSADLILDILNINDEKENYKKDIINRFEKGE